MFETGATKSIKKIFTKILEGSDINEKFSDLLGQSYNSSLDSTYNPKQILEILRLFKNSLRDGFKVKKRNAELHATLHNMTGDLGFDGIKHFVKTYNIELFDFEMYSRLEKIILDASKEFAEILAQDIDIILIENNKMRNPLAISDTRIVSTRALTHIIIRICDIFKVKLYNAYIDKINESLGLDKITERANEKVDAAPVDAVAG